MVRSKNKLLYGLVSVLLMLFCLVFASCGADQTLQVELNYKEVTIEDGDSVVLTVSDPETYVYTWSVEDPSVVSIVSVGDAKAEVSGSKVGTTVVNAQVDGKTVASCTVTVTEKEFYVNLPLNTLVLRKNQEATVRILYSGTLKGTVTWTSSDESIATVRYQNDIAIVTAIKRGDCEITVTNGTVVKTFTVQVGVTG